MSLTRYGIATLCGGCGQRGGGWTPVEDESGPFVMASDVARLKAERDRAEAEIARLKGELDQLRAKEVTP